MAGRTIHFVSLGCAKNRVDTEVMLGVAAQHGYRLVADPAAAVTRANGCVRCHGTLGRGDGPSAATLVDDWGHPIRPADLTQGWTFRGGSTREDIFRTMTTGLNGTPMPSFQRLIELFPATENAISRICRSV